MIAVEPGQLYLNTRGAGMSAARKLAKGSLYAALLLVSFLAAHTAHATVYIETKYGTQLGVQLVGSSEFPAIANTFFFPTKTEMGSTAFQLNEIEYSGLLHCYEDNDRIVVEKVSTNPDDMRRYFVKAKAVQGTLPQLTEMPYDDVEIWFYDHKTGEKSVEALGVSLQNPVSLQLGNEQITRLRDGMAHLECRVEKQGSESVQFFYELTQRQTDAIQALMQYSLTESQFADVLTNYRQAVETELWSFIEIDEEIYWTEAGEQISEVLDKYLSDEIIAEYRNSIFVPIQTIKEYYGGDDWNTFAEEVREGVFKIIEPTRFNNVTTDIIRNREYYRERQIGIGLEQSIAVPIEGFLVPFTDAKRYDQRDVSDYSDYYVWRGRNEEVGHEKQNVELHIVDSQMLSNDVTFHKLMRVLQEKTSFYLSVQVPFTGRDRELTPYSLQELEYTYSDPARETFVFDEFMNGRTQDVAIGLEDVGLRQLDLITGYLLEVREIQGKVQTGVPETLTYNIPSYWQRFETHDGKDVSVGGNVVTINDFGLIMSSEHWDGGGWNSVPNWGNIEFAFSRATAWAQLYLGLRDSLE